jgi:hypothetical protein
LGCDEFAFLETASAVVVCKWIPFTVDVAHQQLEFELLELPGVQ